MSSVLIRGIDLVKTYDDGRIRALDRVNFEILAGESVVIRGPSGCGKSTMMQLIGYLESPDSGALFWQEKPYTKLSPNHFRSRNVGFIFQLHNLLPTLTARQNVEVPMFEMDLSRRQRKMRAKELLKEVDMQHRADSFPRQLSGGERQRVAVARALANDPLLLLADEPTGSLDSKAGKRVMNLIENLRVNRGLTVLLATHDEGVSQSAQRRLNMLDGKII